MWVISWLPRRAAAVATACPANVRSAKSWRIYAAVLSRAKAPNAITACTSCQMGPRSEGRSLRQRHDSAGAWERRFSPAELPESDRAVAWHPAGDGLRSQAVDSSRAEGVSASADERDGQPI